MIELLRAHEEGDDQPLGLNPEATPPTEIKLEKLKAEEKGEYDSDAYAPDNPADLYRRDKSIPISKEAKKYLRGGRIPKPRKKKAI